MPDTGATGQTRSRPLRGAGVPSTSSEREIRHAFHELARKYDPDVAVGDPGAACEFIEASEAAQTLLDPGGAPSNHRYRTPRAPAAYRSPAPPPPARTAPAGQRPPDVPVADLTKIGAATRTTILGKGRHSHPGDHRGRRHSGPELVVSTATAPDRVHRHQGPAANGTVLWKATGYRMDDGGASNLAWALGRRHPDIPRHQRRHLEVDSGYLPPAGTSRSCRRGAPPSYPACFTALLRAGSQAEPLDAITPRDHAHLVLIRQGTGDIAYIHVTGKTSPASS